MLCGCGRGGEGRSPSHTVRERQATSPGVGERTPRALLECSACRCRVWSLHITGSNSHSSSIHPKGGGGPLIWAKGEETVTQGKDFTGFWRKQEMVMGGMALQLQGQQGAGSPV